MKQVSPLLIWVLAVSPCHFRGDESFASQMDAVVGNKVSVAMKYKITAQPKTRLLVLDVVLPRSIPGRQKVLDISYSAKPAAIFEKNGQLYAQFCIDQFPKDLEIVIDVNAEVYRYDFATASRNEKNRQLEKYDNLKQWLIQEQYLEKQSPVIQEAAKGLSGKDEEESIRKCFDFAVKTLTKRPYDGKDYGAVWALQQKKGDCTEFADLFITLCRAKGIPARFCQGYLLEPVPDTPKHDWAQVYTEKYGWIPFDPYYTYLGKATTFSERRPIYLLLDEERRNGVLQNHHYWAYRYEGSPVQVKDEFRVNKLEKLEAK